MTNDWNTPMPSTSDISRYASDFAARGYDVHTVRIVLNNGDWAVEMEWTDHDLQDGETEYVLGEECPKPPAYFTSDVEAYAAELYNRKAESPREMTAERWTYIKQLFPSSARLCIAEAEEAMGMEDEE